MTTDKKSRIRVILHGDMDAFFAAVEQRDRPELVGKPVVVGGTGARAVVSTASYEARRFGVRSAMPMRLALRKCPDAVVLPPDFERYRAASEQMLDVFHRYSPLVEPLSLDEAFLDMTGAEGLFGSPRETARRIRRDVFEATGGLTLSMGGSATKYVAKVACDFQKPDGITIVPQEEVLSFLHPLPVSRLWGAGEKSRKILEARGFYTIGQVARSSKKIMEGLLGSLGAQLFELANGIDSREVVPDRDAKSIGKEFTLETDIRGREEILPVLQIAADKTARGLRSKGLEASGVRVKLKTDDFRLLTRQTNLSRPADSAAQLFEAAAGLLEKMPLEYNFRLVGTAAFNLKPKNKNIQGCLFKDPAREKQEKLDRAMDAVREKFGEPALRRGTDEALLDRSEIKNKTSTEKS